jgi:hypothetical protein
VARIRCLCHLLRYVRDISQPGYLNIGVLAFEQRPKGSGRAFAGVRFTHDFERLRGFDPHFDIEVYLAIEQEISSGLTVPIFDVASVVSLLETTLSTTIQISDEFFVEADSLARALDQVYQAYVAGEQHPPRSLPQDGR